MTIDLSTLKPGDSVVHRNGGKSAVRFASYDGINISVFLYFDQCRMAPKFNLTGSYGGMEENHPFDIISIEPAPAKQTPLEAWIEKYIYPSQNPATGQMTITLRDLHDLVQAINETLREMEKK